MLSRDLVSSHTHPRTQERSKSKKRKKQQQQSDDDDDGVEMSVYVKTEPITLVDRDGKPVAYGVVEDPEPPPNWLEHYDNSVIPRAWRVPHMWLEISITQVLASKRAQTHRFPVGWIFDSEHNVELEARDLVASELHKACSEEGRTFIVYHPQLVVTRYRKQPRDKYVRIQSCPHMRMLSRDLFLLLGMRMRSDQGCG